MNKNWIYLNEFKNEKNVLMLFRKEIKNLDSEFATIKIHATTFYKLKINGEFVARGNAPSDPNFPSFDTWKVDVSKKDFCIGVLVYSLGEKTEMVTEQNKGASALNVEITVGDRVIVTDNSWKCIADPSYFRGDLLSMDPMAHRISRWGGYKEIYDTNKELKDFSRLNFNDSAWKNADINVTANNEYGELIPRDILPLVEYSVYPKNILQIDNNLGQVSQKNNFMVFNASYPGSFPSVIYDFGKEVVGYISLTVNGEKNSNLSIWYGESLDLIRIDTFVLNGEEQTLVPFNRRAFRYIKIVVNGAVLPVVLKEIKLTMTHYPLNENNKLIFNDGGLQKIYDTSLYTTMLGSQQHFEDSIFREQMQWLLDSRLMALVHYECFNEFDYALKTIKQFARTQNANGSIKAAGPQACNQLLPDFCMHYIIMVEEWIRYSCRNIDSDILQAVNKQIQWLLDNEDENGFLSVKNKKDWWCFIDWAELDKRDEVTALNCLYYQSLKAYCQILKKQNIKYAIFNDRAEKLKRNINEKMFNAKIGLFVDCVEGGIQSAFASQQTNIYSVITGVAENPSSILSIILDSSFNGVKINGAFLMCLTAECLVDNNFIKDAKTIIQNYWGEMLNRNATTWWETFNMNTNKASVPYAFSQNSATYLCEFIPVSYCHGWGAGIAYTLKKHKDKLDAK